MLDPFCGCGTALNVAERLKRRWIGIDITHLAITLIKKRLHDSFGPDLAPYEVIGEPADILSAEALALTNRHQFEWWALGRVEARPAQDKKKGADSGIDGVIHFNDDNSGKYKRVLIQVKSGGVKAGDIRDLKGVLDREQAAIGALPDPEAAHQTHAGGGRGRGVLRAGPFSRAPVSPAANPHHRRAVRRQRITVPALRPGRNLQKGRPPAERAYPRSRTL